MSNLLNKLLKSGSIKATSILAESTLFNDKDQIPTDIPILNIALSGKVNGGITPGLTFLAGPSRHFKSLLGLMMVKAYMKWYPDAICLLFDSEFGITPEYIKTNDIDPNRVIHIPVEHLEQLKFDIAKRLDTIDRGDKVIIFIDSVGNLASKKEYEDALEEKSVADMSRAKVLKSLWRIVTPHLTTKDIPCIAVNHTYQEMANYPKTIMSGGCLLAGTNIIMSNGSLAPIETIQVGDAVKTLLGDRRVTAIWNPDTLTVGTPECYEVEFDDGYKVVCSDNHKFLDENMNWVEAKNLVSGARITSTS